MKLKLFLAVGFLSVFLSACGGVTASTSSGQLTFSQLNTTLQKLFKGTFGTLKVGSAIHPPSWFLLGVNPHAGAVSSITVFNIAVSSDVTDNSSPIGVPAIQANVDLQACAGSSGYQSSEGPYNIADDISQVARLVPPLTYGSPTSTVWLSPDSSESSVPRLIPGNTFTSAPSLGPNQCFRGVLIYWIPADGFESRGSSYFLLSYRDPLFEGPGFNLSYMWS